MMNRIALLGVVLLSACGGVSLDSYRDSDLQFDPVQFFNGDLVAEGFVRARSGEVLRSFTATIKGSWTPEKGVLDEHFVWSDGEEQDRVWTFVPTEYGYAGTAGDVVGEARMEHAGRVIRMLYQLEVPLDSGNSIVVSMEDWMVQSGADRIVSVTDMTKFGFRVGQVVLSMSRVE
jgi:hypothetical protein